MHTEGKMIEMVSKHGTLKILSSTTIHAANKKNQISQGLHLVKQSMNLF